MSHLKERKEKNCLNCQAQLVGRYCHVCGQENLEPRETVWHLVSHFFNDITHFDGKFFATVKYLLRKPGFLSHEYSKGRRMAYLNPIRMYVFTSAIFFIILYSLTRPGDMMHVTTTKDKPVGIAELQAQEARRQKRLASADDADDREELRSNIQKGAIEIAAIKKTYGDTTTRKFTEDELTGILVQAYIDSASVAEGLRSADSTRFKNAVKHISNPIGTTNIFGWSGDYTSVEDYDSVQRALPDSARDGWFKHLMMRRGVVIAQEWHEDSRLFKEHLGENVLHSFPKILFVSLPIFALILNMLYFRHKQYYYVNHGIFTIHVYCATFILMLAGMLINQLDKALGVHWVHVVCDLLVFGIFLYAMIYLYKAMRGFYKQGRGKTFLKYFITFVTASVINLILLFIFLLITLFSV
ncbi:MAG TPA: DUF3667 domain-containing protein [Puia sp.]|nr:DUF3667 domain-containing protein [Puia sp.]